MIIVLEAIFLHSLT